MAEVVSYWKTTCSPLVVVKPPFLHPSAVSWWKKLYFCGLGEFFYLNGIVTTMESFMTIQADQVGKLSWMQPVVSPQRVLVPVGGGKDSVVTLELLKGAGFDVIPFIVNPRGASLQCVLKAGFADSDVFRVSRKLDSEMLRMNDQGFLNGHTPFSALLAFASLPAAFATGSQHIALSNESSANESTVPGSTVNHQYSKTIDFENDFRDYLKQYITTEVNYFSFLRPLNELQIAARFSTFTNHHAVFRSCNVGSKTDTWCGKCPKCLFTAIMLAPFLGVERVHRIFGSPLLNDISLMPVLCELAGESPVKPFECVGTVDEVRAAIGVVLAEGEEAALLSRFASEYPVADDGTQFRNILNESNYQHHVPPQFLRLIHPPQ